MRPVVILLVAAAISMAKRLCASVWSPRWLNQAQGPSLPPRNASAPRPLTGLLAALPPAIGDRSPPATPLAVVAEGPDGTGAVSAEAVDIGVPLPPPGRAIVVEDPAQ